VDFESTDAREPISDAARRLSDLCDREMDVRFYSFISVVEGSTFVPHTLSRTLTAAID